MIYVKNVESGLWEASDELNHGLVIKNLDTGKWEICDIVNARVQQHRQSIQPNRFGPMRMLSPAAGVKFCSGPPRFHCGLFMESVISLCSGLFLWVGLWDLIDVYLFPEHWASKIVLMFLGVLGLWWNRGLYTDAQVAALPKTCCRCCCCSSSHLLSKDAAASPKRTGYTQQLDSIAEPPAGDTEYRPLDKNNIAHTDHVNHTNEMDEDTQDGTTSSHDSDHKASTVHRQQQSNTKTSLPNSPPHKRRFFRCPPFHAILFFRSLLGILCAIMLWIGFWDWIDEYFLPFIGFNVSDHSAFCIIPRLVFVVTGISGLYITESLYTVDGGAPEESRNAGKMT